MPDFRAKASSVVRRSVRYLSIDRRSRCWRVRMSGAGRQVERLLTTLRKQLISLFRRPKAAVRTRAETPETTQRPARTGLAPGPGCTGQRRQRLARAPARTRRPRAHGRQARVRRGGADDVRHAGTSLETGRHGARAPFRLHWTRYCVEKGEASTSAFARSALATPVAQSCCSKLEPAMEFHDHTHALQRAPRRFAAD